MINQAARRTSPRSVTPYATDRLDLAELGRPFSVSADQTHSTRDPTLSVVPWKALAVAGHRAHIAQSLGLGTITITATQVERPALKARRAGGVDNSPTSAAVASIATQAGIAMSAAAQVDQHRVGMDSLFGGYLARSSRWTADGWFVDLAAEGAPSMPDVPTTGPGTG
ncbi:MAG TPA: hypothetical protein VIP98_03140 [Microlunatus sp.]